jgi:flagellar assembly protein FliH
MTTNLLRPDWATAPDEGNGRSRGIRVFELPEQSETTHGEQPVHDSAWVAGYRDGRDEGVRDGHEEGLRQGLAEGRAEAMAASQRALAGLDAQLDALRREQADDVEAFAADAVALALEIAEMVLDHHVAVAKDPGAEALARALTVVRPTGTVVARLHPDDLELLGGTPPGVHLELVPDQTVGLGGCRLETSTSQVDATLESAMARVREILMAPGTGAGTDTEERP